MKEKENGSNTLKLRTVSPFATAHTFCASRDHPRRSDFLTTVPAKTEIFLCGL